MCSTRVSKDPEVSLEYEGRTGSSGEEDETERVEGQGFEVMTDSLLGLWDVRSKRV